MDNFIVSARKYRPATFMSVVGQSHITSTLKNAITRGQLAHAYLFCGPRGVGKTTCARIFAKAINCLDPKEGEACNECESCKAFNEGRSFNIHELDAASNNSVDDIRNLTDQVRIPPQIGKYSIYIIDEVHMLSLSAFNAFLKTLEEPPAHAVFILATTEKHKIIPTILSRCQIYDFNRIRVEDSVEYLKYIAGEENVSFDEEALHIIAQKADGGMRDALSMFDKVVSFSGNNLTAALVAETLNVLDYETYFNVTQYILEGDYTKVLLLFDEVLRKGFGGQIFIAGLNEHFRNLLMCKNPQTVSLLEVTGSVAKRYLEQSKQCEVEFLFESINLLTGVDSGFRTATNQRLHVELGLMKLCGMSQKKNLTDASAAPVLPDPVKTASASQPQPTAPSEVNPVKPVAASKEIKPQENVRNETKEDAAPVPVGTTGKEIPPVREGEANSNRQASRPVTSFSLKDAINGNGRPAAEEEEAKDEEALSLQPDENSESIITQACNRLSDELMEERPRLATALKEVTVKGNLVTFRVSNESLKDEIEFNMLELRRRICEIGNIKYLVNFDFIVEEDSGTLKPIKAEDKLRYMTESNPELTAFRKALDLDIE